MFPPFSATRHMSALRRPRALASRRCGTETIDVHVAAQGADQEFRVWRLSFACAVASWSDARARPSRGQPARAREHGGRDGAPPSSGGPTASSSTSTAPPTACSCVRHDAETPAGPLGDLTLGRARTGAARGPDAGRGARRPAGDGWSTSRSRTPTPAPPRPLVVAARSSRSARPSVPTTCWCRRSTSRPSTGCRAARPGVPTGLLSFGIAPDARSLTTAVRTATPRCTPTSGRSRNVDVGGVRRRGRTASACRSTCGPSTTPSSSAAAARGGHRRRHHRRRRPLPLRRQGTIDREACRAYDRRAAAPRRGSRRRPATGTAASRGDLDLVDVGALHDLG